MHLHPGCLAKKRKECKNNLQKEKQSCIIESFEHFIGE